MSTPHSALSPPGGPVDASSVRGVGTATSHCFSTVVFVGLAGQPALNMGRFHLHFLKKKVSGAFLAPPAFPPSQEVGVLELQGGEGAEACWGVGGDLQGPRVVQGHRCPSSGPLQGRGCRANPPPKSKKGISASAAPPKPSQG